MFSTCEEARDEIYKATEAATNDIQAAMEGTKGEMGKVAGEINDSLERAEGQIERDAGAKPMGTTYADALSSQLPSTHPSMLARSRVGNRQVLLRILDK